MWSSSAAAYLVAAALTLAAAAIRVPLGAALGGDLPYLTFFAAIAVSAWYGGYGPGMTTTVMSAGAAAYWFLGVQVARRGLAAGDVIGLVLFVAIGWLISALSGRLQQARDAQLVEAVRLRTILQSIGDGVIVTDGAGVVTMLNPVAEQLTGWTTPAASGQKLATVFRIVNEDTRADVPNPAVGALAEGAIVGLANHTILISKAGTEVPIDDSAAPVRGPDGAISGSVLVFRDITERRRSDAAVRDSEEELSDFVANATVALHWLDPDGVILRANQTDLDLLGYAADHYVGRNIAEFHDDPATIAAVLARLTSGAVVRDQPARLRCRDGSTKDVLISASGRWDGGRFVHSRCVSLDVTERRRAEEARGQLAAIIESSADSVISKSLDGRLLTWNRGAQDMYGYTADEAVGRSVDLIIPDDLRDAERDLLRRVSAGERVDPFETVRVSRDGRRLDVSLTLSPIRDDQGRITGASSIARDIGGQKLLEQSLRDADRRKDEFLAVLAHELRNPLAPISNSVAAMQLAAPADPDVRRASDVIERQSRHMARLLDDLLDVSRITRNKLELRREPVPLQNVLDLALETSRPLLEANQQVVTLSSENAALLVDADAMRLAQVFSNLVGNASKYSGRGTTIRISTRLDGVTAIITVQDQGIGISAEALPTIFEMFSQASPAIDRSQAGLGIGLALVKGLVELHGGTVSARSEGAGRGSTFEVRLAVDPVLSAAKPSGDRASGARADGRRVVIADDNHDGADSLALVLRAYGHEVLTTYNGADAVEAAAAFRPEVLVLDLGMPLMNGYEAARQLRAMPGGDALVLIAVTGWGQQRDREQTRLAGFDAHFVKPVDAAAIQHYLIGNSRPATGG